MVSGLAIRRWIFVMYDIYLNMRKENRRLPVDIKCVNGI